jgi:methyl-accepting chemotaxis protein
MNLGIRAKILGSYFIIIAFLAAVGVTGAVFINMINSADTFMYEKTTKPLGYLNNMNNGLRMAGSGIQKYLRTTDPAARKASQDAIQALLDSTLDEEAKYPATYIDANDQKAFETYLAAKNEWIGEIKKLYAAYDAAADALLARPKSAALPPGTDLIPVVDTTAYNAAGAKLIKILDDVTAGNITGAQAVSDENTARTSTSLVIIAILAALAVVFALALGIVLTRSILRTFRVVEDSGEYVTSGTAQISASAEELAQGASE